MIDNFETWSVDKAFTRGYYPCKISCNYCLIPKSDAHMCVYNSGEFVKMQPCPKNAKDLFYALQYRNYVCKSCFMICKPNPTFRKTVDQGLRELRTKMSSSFDEDFINVFCRKVLNFLIIDRTLTCVSCSFSLKDYQWMTYSKIMSSHRKRRLES